MDIRPHSAQVKLVATDRLGVIGGQFGGEFHAPVAWVEDDRMVNAGLSWVSLVVEPSGSGNFKVKVAPGAQQFYDPKDDQVLQMSSPVALDYIESATVDWGDGSPEEQIAVGTTQNLLHEYEHLPVEAVILAVVLKGRPGTVAGVPTAQRSWPS